MKSSRLLARTPPLVVGVSLLVLAVAACNKQPSATEAPMVAPPVAALPLAGGSPPPAAPAPAAAALAPAPTPVRYAPRPRRDSYGYIDQAYSMGQAFADTPPDYAVDYQGTRPWIWRSGSGAYRIAERLPQGERYFYYDAGQDYPFLVQDPDYSYGYDNGELVAVYGPDGAELNDAYAAQRADYASRYLYRGRQLYRAAQEQQRESVYAGAWADRQDQIVRQNQLWQQQQTQNADWRAWHDAHQTQEQQQWQQERQSRLAYAAAIGLAAASQATAPDPTQLARRQATYFANWNEGHGQAPAAQPASSSQANAPVTRTAPPVIAVQSPRARTAPPIAAVQNAPVGKQRMAEAQKTQAVAAAEKAAQDAQIEKQAAETQQHDTKAAQANSAQAAHAQQLAARAQRREAAAAQTKGTEAAKAQKLVRQAKQSQAADAQAKATQAAQAQSSAAEAKQREEAVAQGKAAQAARAQQSADRAKQREAAAAQAKAADTSHAKQLEAQPKHPNAAAAETGRKAPPDNAKRRNAKDRPAEQPQEK